MFFFSACKLIVLFRVQISFSSKEEKNWEVDYHLLLSGNVRLKLVGAGVTPQARHTAQAHSTKGWALPT